MIKSRKGQITIFVIVAILIVAGIVLFFYVKEKSSSLTPSIPQEIQPVYNSVQSCLKKTAENALTSIGEQGGYIFISEDIPSIKGQIPYYLIGKKRIVPTEEEIGLNLAKFVEEELEFCTLNFKELQPQYNISGKLNKASASISNNNVKFSLNYPLTITYKGSSYQLNDFNIEIPIKLKTIINVSQEIISPPMRNNDTLCLTCIYQLAKEDNISIQIYNYENSSTIFNFLDDEYEINNESYKFTMAIKHD